MRTLSTGVVLALIMGWQQVSRATSEQASEQGSAPSAPAVETTHPRATLIIGSQALLGKVVVLDPRFREAGRFTEAQVTVQNLTDYSYSLEYKFDWTDADGFAVDSGTVWHRFNLSPRQIEYFKSVGKRPEATNILFTVRFPEDVTID